MSKPLLFLLIALCVFAASQNCGCSSDEPCCSQYGYCGSTADYCDKSKGCKSGCWGGETTKNPPDTPAPTGPSSGCFPFEAKFRGAVPSVSRSNWWCNANRTYGFLGFSYPMEDGDCNSYSNSYDKLKSDFANMKAKFGATFVRIYLPTCRSTSVWKNLVKAGRDTNMGIVPMIFWDWNQNDNVMYQAENGFLGVFQDSEVGRYAPYVIHSVAFGDELGEQGNYWLPLMKDFKNKLAQYGVPLTISDDWDRDIFRNGDSLTDFGRQVNDVSDLTHVHIMPYYHPWVCPDAWNFWGYFQNQIQLLVRNKNKRPIMISQSCWASDGSGHGRGSHDDARNMDNFKQYWNTINDNCQYFKTNRVGWFIHAYSDSGEPGFGMLDWNGNPKYNFYPKFC